MDRRREVLRIPGLLITADDDGALSLILLRPFQRAVNRANCGAFLLGSHHFKGMFYQLEKGVDYQGRLSL